IGRAFARFFSGIMRHSSRQGMYEAKVATAIKTRSGSVASCTYPFLWVLLLCWHVCLLPARADIKAAADSSGPDQIAERNAEIDLEREEAASWDRIVPNKANPAQGAVRSAVERGTTAVAVALFLAWVLAMR